MVLRPEPAFLYGQHRQFRAVVHGVSGEEAPEVPAAEARRDRSTQMLVDANVLLYAVDNTSRFNATAAAWLEEVLNGPRRVGMAWPTLTAFLRITTHPRALAQPLSPASAWSYVEEWLACDNVWIPGPTERHAGTLAGLLTAYDLRGNPIAASCRPRPAVVSAAGHPLSRVRYPPCPTCPRPPPIRSSMRAA